MYYGYDWEYAYLSILFTSKSEFYSLLRSLFLNEISATFKKIINKIYQWKSEQNAIASVFVVSNFLPLFFFFLIAVVQNQNNTRIFMWVISVVPT